MTTFYPYQWDLNYANPDVFNIMVDNLLNLANHGVDVLRIDAVPYIWKELGTSCRNLPQVHTIVRMLRMICEVVCPGVLLLGEVVMEPARVAPYFGTVEKPECHMLYNVTTMASIWHTLATGKVSLLKHQLDVINGLPGEYVFLNYLRCHDDIGWGLEYSWLQKEEMEEVPHKKFLNAYFTGNWPGSVARGRPRIGRRKTLRHHSLPVRPGSGRRKRQSGGSESGSGLRPDAPCLYDDSVRHPYALQRRRDRGAQRLQL